MGHRPERRLPNGRTVAVHRNDGLRKICERPRRVWAKCRHPRHFSFKWKGRSYRFSLDRHASKHVETKTEAESLADDLRTRIRAGAFKAAIEREARRSGEPETILTFSEFAETWKKRKGHTLVNARDNSYRLGTICRFVLPASAPPRTFGASNVLSITTNDIDAFRDFRKADGLSSVTINHDLRLLRKMFNWGIRSGLLARTPFKIGTEPAISLERRRHETSVSKTTTMRRGCSPLRTITFELSSSRSSTRHVGLVNFYPLYGGTCRSDAGRSASAPKRRRPAENGLSQSHRG
jgi:hypothetical protein